MALSVTHTFVSAIADDPAASTAGEVLPSHWNAAHTLTGQVDLTSQVTGILPTANGGTGTSTGYLPRTVNAQTGASYTILASDIGKLVTTSNAGAVAVTLPQATGSFAAGSILWVENKGAGTATITPTTSTIDGSATLALTTNQGVTLVSDGTNWTTIRGIGGAGGGTPGGSSGQFQYDNAGAFGGANEWFVSANVIAQANSTTAQARYVYNTVDSVTSPTNYERAVLDWTTSANVLTIGTQAGGTGTLRDLSLVAGTNINIGSGTNSTINIGTGSSRGYFSNYQGVMGLILQNANNAFFWSHSSVNGIRTGSGNMLQWASTADANLGSTDTALARPAAAMVEVNTGSAAGVAYLRLNAVAVASLPAASATYKGARGTVSDANATTFLSTVAGGGSNIVPVFCDGTAWKIG